MGDDDIGCISTSIIGSIYLYDYKGTLAFSYPADFLIFGFVYAGLYSMKIEGEDFTLSPSTYERKQSMDYMDVMLSLFLS